MCVLVATAVHVLVVAVVPAAAREPVPQARELVFMSVEELRPVLPEPQLPEPPAPEPPAPEPPAIATPVARREAPRPVTPAPAAEPPPQVEEAAPPPAAAPVLAATAPATGGPAFTQGAAGGSAHGLGSTVREGVTDPTATRVTAGTAPAVDYRGLTRGYLRRLGSHVRPGVVYPRAAIAAHLEGTVTLGLVVDENGRVVRWRVKRSSGYATLDSAVLDAARRLTTVPAPPAELRPVWQQQEISVPVRMRL